MIRYEETVARQVLEAVFPGSEMKFRPEQSHEEYDFDLHYGDGSIAAIEVTCSTNQVLRQMSVEIFSTRKGGSAFPAKKSKKSWFISVSVGADIKHVRRHADERLAILEAAGIEQFSWTDAFKANCPMPLRDIFTDLKLTAGTVLDSWGPPAEIRMSGPVMGSAVGPATATEAGEREAEANRAKLGKAKTNERHLFVYIDPLNGAAFTALTSFDPPHLLPKLPPEITHIWLAAETQKDQFVLWRGASNEPWTQLELSPVAGRRQDLPQGLKPILNLNRFRHD